LPPLRILTLAPQPFLTYRGTPLATFNFVRTLAEQGHQVDLLSFPQGMTVTAARVRHLRSGWLPCGPIRPGPSVGKLFLDVPFFIEAVTRVLCGRYDFVHAVEEAVLVAPLARVWGVPVLADVDSWIPEQLEESGFLKRGILLRLVRWLYKSALRAASLVVTPCGSLAEQVREEIAGARVETIGELPLQPEDRVVDPGRCVRLREELFPPTDPQGSSFPLVAYCGNLEPTQGVDLLVAAADGLTSVRFVIAGGEPAQVATLQAEAKRRGVSDRCRFLGRRPPSTCLDVLDCADVLVAPRLHGRHTGFKIATYMASGKPLVATRIPAHTQILDSSMATLVEPTASGVRDGLRRVLDDPVEANQRARRAQTYARRHFDAERFGRAVAAALEPLRRDDRRPIPDERSVSTSISGTPEPRPSGQHPLADGRVTTL
jgi:glycosyltransferase involved in cell wall biosynthesis